MLQIEQTPTGTPSGTTVYAPLDETRLYRRVEDLERKSKPEAPVAGASVRKVMRHRLKRKAGNVLYKLRQQTVEPVAGIIEAVVGFRQFLLHEVNKSALE